VDVGLLIFEAPDGRVLRRVVLKGGANTLGRDDRNDIKFTAEAVSGFHARVVFAAGEARITDLRSRNGTTVNGEALAPDVERVLAPGDRIGIGPFVARYVLAGGGAPRVPAPEVAGKLVRQSTLPAQRPARFRPRPAPQGQRSRLLDFLPPIYEQRDVDGVLNGLLLVCETILAPLDRQISQIHHYLDPDTAPESMLPWLASWVCLALDESWPLARRRALVRSAAELYRWRGTRRGLSSYIAIYTGLDPTIVEPGEERAKPLPADAQRVLPGDQPGELRVVPLGPADRRPLDPLTFRVVVAVAEGGPVDLLRLHQIIESEKPAHTAYALYVRRPASS